MIRESPFSIFIYVCVLFGGLEFVVVADAHKVTYRRGGHDAVVVDAVVVDAQVVGEMFALGVVVVLCSGGECGDEKSRQKGR